MEESAGLVRRHQTCVQPPMQAGRVSDRGPKPWKTALVVIKFRIGARWLTGQEGISLLELTIAMTLFATLAVSLGGPWGSYAGWMKTVERRVEVLGEARIAQAYITKDLNEAATLQCDPDPIIDPNTFVHLQSPELDFVEYFVQSCQGQNCLFRREGIQEILVAVGVTPVTPETCVCPDQEPCVSPDQSRAEIALTFKRCWSKADPDACASRPIFLQATFAEP